MSSRDSRPRSPLLNSIPFSWRLSTHNIRFRNVPYGINHNKGLFPRTDFRLLHTPNDQIDSSILCFDPEYFSQNSMVVKFSQINQVWNRRKQVKTRLRTTANNSATIITTKSPKEVYKN